MRTTLLFCSTLKLEERRARDRSIHQYGGRCPPPLHHAAYIESDGQCEVCRVSHLPTGFAHWSERGHHVVHYYLTINCLSTHSFFFMDMDMSNIDSLFFVTLQYWFRYFKKFTILLWNNTPCCTLFFMQKKLFVCLYFLPWNYTPGIPPIFHISLPYSKDRWEIFLQSYCRNLNSELTLKRMHFLFSSKFFFCHP